MSHITHDTMNRLSDTAILLADARLLLADAIEEDLEVNAKAVAYRVALMLTHAAELLSPEYHAPEVAMSTLKHAWKHSHAAWPKPWQKAEAEHGVDHAVVAIPH